MQQVWPHKPTFKTTAKCQRGGKDKHEEQCDEHLICSNCKGPHAVSAKNCPLWKKEKEIQRIRVEKHVSFPEARQLMRHRSLPMISWLNLWSVRHLTWISSDTPVQTVHSVVHVSGGPDRYRPVPRLPPGSQGRFWPTPGHCASPH